MRMGGRQENRDEGKRKTKRRAVLGGRRTNDETAAAVLLISIAKIAIWWGRDCKACLQRGKALDKERLAVVQ